MEFTIQRHLQLNEVCDGFNKKKYTHTQWFAKLISNESFISKLDLIQFCKITYQKLVKDDPVVVYAERIIIKNEIIL